MTISTNYRWEAEKADGQIITAGGDLSDCVRLTLIPSVPYLPRHSVAGVPLVRRFCRAFHKVRFNDYLMLPGLLSWEAGTKYVWTSEDLRAFVAPGQMIKKRHDGEKWWPVTAVDENCVTLALPYDGKSKEIESKRLIPRPSAEYVHCIVCRGFRLYILYSDGRSLVTPEDYELYL